MKLRVMLLAVWEPQQSHTQRLPQANLKDREKVARAGTHRDWMNAKKTKRNVG